MRKDESTLIYLSSDETKVKQIKLSKYKILLGLIIVILISVVGGKFALDFVIDFSQNSKIAELKRNNQYLKSRLDEMNNVVENITTQMAEIEKKDDELRMIMGIKELDEDVRNVGIGGSSFDYGMGNEGGNEEYGFEVDEYFSKILKLEREVKLELTSYTDLISTYQLKEDSIRYLPAMNPVLSGRIISKVGVRLHPILNVRRHHEGIDISAKRGTPIFAAADGVVKLAKYNGGYGKIVYLDHLYGYETRYGHMDKILVRKGQKVKRGDKIGLVGKTGLAEGPHLHYEVRYNGEIMDPRQYYFDDFELNNKVVSRE